MTVKTIDKPYVVTKSRYNSWNIVHRIVIGDVVSFDYIASANHPDNAKHIAKLLNQDLERNNDKE